MNILFLVNHYPPGGPIGGIVTYTKLMAQAWHEADHRVSVLCQSLDQDRHEENQGGIRIVRVPSRQYPGSWKDKIKFRLTGDNSWRLLFHKELSWAFLCELMTWRELPDIVESPEAFAWSWAIQKETDLPVVLRLHGPNQLAYQADPDNFQLQARHLDTLEIWCLKNARGIVPPTHFLGSYARSVGARVTEVIAYPFIVPELSGVVNPSQTQKSTIATVGRLIPGKGFETAIKVLSHLEASWQLKIIGPDDFFGPEKKSYQQELKKLAQDLSVEDRVIFTGALDHQEVITQISQATVLMHDSRNDNMPFAILEALSLNIPVIASAIGGIPETVENKGQIIKLGDVPGYVQAIKNLKNMETREWIRDRHDPQNIQCLMESCFHKILNQ